MFFGGFCYLYIVVCLQITLFGNVLFKRRFISKRGLQSKWLKFVIECSLQELLAYLNCMHSAFASVLASCCSMFYSIMCHGTKI